MSLQRTMARLMTTAAIAMQDTAAAQGLIEPAEGSWYVSGFVGAVFPDVGNDFEDVFGVEFEDDVYFGGAIGAKLPFLSLGFVHPRIEAEVSYSNIGIDTDGAVDDFVSAGFGDSPTVDTLVALNGTDSDLLLILGNSYANLTFGDYPLIIPYIGGGLGVAIIGDLGGATETDFATNTAIGLTLPINKLDLYTEGRYIRVYDDGPDFEAISITAGLRWNF